MSIRINFLNIHILLEEKYALKMASVNMEQAKKKFHATDRLEVPPSSKPGSSTFFCLGYLLTNGPGEEQREITMRNM